MPTEKRKKQMRTYYQTHKEERKAYQAEYNKKYKRSTTPIIRRESRTMWQREKKVRDVNTYILQHTPAGVPFVKLCNKILSGEVRLTV